MKVLTNITKIRVKNIVKLRRNLWEALRYFSSIPDFVQCHFYRCDRIAAAGSVVETKNVFLPFEGGRGLSLIISKAFLLADDDKITDAMILSWLKG